MGGWPDRKAIGERGPGATDPAELGIHRVSTGSLPYRAALDAAVGVATALRDGAQPVAATPYPDAQQCLVRVRS